ncbi:MAG: hypothetical protein ABR511_13915 [Acidimicrobiales bacterium]
MDEVVAVAGPAVTAPGSVVGARRPDASAVIAAEVVLDASLLLGHLLEVAGDTFKIGREDH